MAIEAASCQFARDIEPSIAVQLTAIRLILVEKLVVNHAM